MVDTVMTIDGHSIGLLREMVEQLTGAIERVSTGFDSVGAMSTEAKDLMAAAGISVGDDFTLFYQMIPGVGQQCVAGELVVCAGSWVGLKRADTGKPTWRNLRLGETVEPGLPQMVKMGTCQKCKKPFPQASEFEVYCSACATVGHA